MGLEDLSEGAERQTGYIMDRFRTPAIGGQMASPLNGSAEAGRWARRVESGDSLRGIGFVFS
jgi:hypothetical protein